MQNAANLGVKNTYKCSMKFDSIRISLICERYWFEIRDVLVPTFHGVKSTKCEIYGSKKHAYTLLPSSLANCNASLIKKKYTCECLPFNELLLSNCLHQPIKTFAHMTNVV